MPQTKSLQYEKWLYPIIVWVVQFINALLSAFIIRQVFPINGEASPFMFSAWDSGFYLRIAEYGYPDLRITAFYPLYPLLIRGLHALTGLSYFSSGFIIANISFLIALIFLYQFILEEHEDSWVAKHTLWLLVAFPAALFFNCIYTESINLLFLVLFFYFLQRHYWYGALFAGALAAITHGFGLLLILSGLAYLWQQRNKTSQSQILLRVFSLMIIPAGVFLYMIFLYFKTGTPFAFVIAHKYWAHKSIIPVFHIIDYLYNMYFNPHAVWHYKFIETIHGVFALIMVLMGLLMITIYRKEFNLPIKIFYVITVLLSISSGPGGHLDSFSRYVVVLFPGFIVWAYACKHRELLFLLSIAIMLPLKTILLGCFVNGYWLT